MTKRGDALSYWLRNKHKLAPHFENIHGCEVRLKGCSDRLFTTLAHRHKRIWYVNQKEKLIDINEVIMACTNCHEKIEHDAELTEKVFKKLRKT